MFTFQSLSQFEIKTEQNQPSFQPKINLQTPFALERAFKSHLIDQFKSNLFLCEAYFCFISKKCFGYFLSQMK